MKLPPASHTFHKSWEQCPRKAYHAYIARDVEREDTQALAWGRRVHEAMDRYITKGEPLPAELMLYAPLYDFPPGYITYSELKLGIDVTGHTCDFFDQRVYARGVIDIALLSKTRPDMAMIIDHKTGKVREEPDELELHALLLRAWVPALRTIKGWYNWLAVNKMGNVHDLSDTEATFRRLIKTQNAIEHSFKLGEEAFPPRQGPLCPWCPHKQCEFHP